MLRELEDRDVPRERLAELLRSGDPAVLHAAVLHLERRLRGGERIERWDRLLPDDLTRIAHDSQLVLAGLSAEGFGLTPPDPPAHLPPRVRVAWLRARILDRPETLGGCQGTALGREVVLELPCARVIQTGLLAALLESADFSFRLAGLAVLRDAADRGFLALAQAQEQALALAEDPVVPVAVAALALLREPWTFALPLPRPPSVAGDPQIQRELVELLRARREVGAVRRWLADPELAPALAGPLLIALGESGGAADVATILDRLQTDPFRFGDAGVNALVLLKRRGISCGDDEALTLLSLFLEGPSLDAAAVAEALSSRADAVTAALEGPLESGAHGDPPWSRIAALLESFGTLKAIARLRAVVGRASERAGWWYAIHALGRLGVTDAETEILARFDDEPEACLHALRFIGGAPTVRAVSERLATTGPTPPWIKDAARLAFELDPSPQLFEQLAAGGLLTNELLGALPAQGAVAQAASLQAIARRPGHPLRLSALRALGRTGGPLAADLLGAVVGDADETIRGEALAALRVLGRRLRDSGSARPPHLGGTTDPGDTLVADAILRRLRARAVEPEIAGRLLDALAGLPHPHLVPIVRPYLRHRSPAIRKRVIACLAAAGPAAASWIAPSLDDDDVTVARQALLALGRIGATGGIGLAAPIAAWLDQSNMNLKKAAAETLASAGDRTVAGKLLHWLSIHDNPGFRQDLSAALTAILGGWFRGVLIDRLDQAADAHAQELLGEALSGKFSATELAEVVQLRGGSGKVSENHWTRKLATSACTGTIGLSAGLPGDLDRELAGRGVVIDFPAPPPESRDPRAWRFPAVRAGRELARALRTLPVDAGVLAQHLAVVHKANVAGQMLLPTLSASEIHALFDAYRDLDEEARAGALQVFAGCQLDPVARLRAAEILTGMPPEEVPALLMRVISETLSVDWARQLTVWPDWTVKEAAARTLLLEEHRPGELWPEADPDRLFAHKILGGAADAAFEWAVKQRYLRRFVQAVRAIEGETAMLARIRAWVERRPDVLVDVLPEIVALGDAGTEELARLASSSAVPLDLRVEALNHSGHRASAEMRDQLRQRVKSGPAALAERAAQLLLDGSNDDDRRMVLEAFLDGAFRESFRVQCAHQDVGFLEARARTAEGPARLRLARLVGDLHDPARVPLLLALWRTGDPELKAETRDLLRALDPTEVLPFVARILDDGDPSVAPSVLDVAGATRIIPASFVERYARAAGGDDWERFFDRMAAAGTLSAPGLAGVLSRKIAQHEHDGKDSRVLRIFVRLDDWSDPARTDELAAVIAPDLAGADRDELVRSIVQSTADLDLSQRLRVLTSFGRASDRPVVLALMDVLLVEPLLRDTLAAPLVAAIERTMTEELEGEPERARRILAYRAARVRTDVERGALVDVLEAALAHRSPRVRLRAHRLLRAHADQRRYLSATRRLLGDDDPTAVRAAIRALAYGRSLDAVGEIAELVFHSNNVVRRAATEGLLHLGEEAVPPLTGLLGRMRPDRRRTLSEIVERMQKGDAEPDALPADDEDA